MVMRESFNGIVRGLPQGVEPTVTVSAPSECYPYTEEISYSYTQPDVTEPGYCVVTVQIEQDREAESGSQWGPFTLTITSPGCQGVSFVADSLAEFDILLKKYRTVSQLSDGTNIYWVKDIDAREILETKANTSDIPTAISDLTDDTSTYPIDKADSVADQRDSSSLKYWTGTKAQYDAIVTKDSDTIYNVEDTTSPIVDILNTLYPIGAIYIGTMATCPLSVLGIGTWQLVAQDRVLQGAGTRGAVGTTINESLPNYEAVFVNHWIDYSTNKALTPVSGAIEVASNTYPKSQYPSIGSQSSGSYNYDQTLKISPSISNQTYQDNAPVQQDGYLVNIWERTA